jgi:hypothetical protein
MSDWIGTLEPSTQADLISVRGNPLEDMGVMNFFFFLIFSFSLEDGLWALKPKARK